MELGIPLKKVKALRRLLERAKGVGEPALIKLQEKLGERITEMAASQLGFSNANLLMHGSNGIDLLMRHTTGTWGIFEAKGGRSKLGNPAIGPQMQGRWINHWIEETVGRNPNNPDGTSLENANDANIPMLAVITRFNVNAVRKQITLTGQQYRGANSITSWPRGTGCNPVFRA